ncbi:hypothetical protein C0Q70_12944 [Pomacea canaliculata]|uniref:ABC transporter domain-containing protein n=1 Tax=Pomacea canaliculata TaxID=400727 RepID=A0A2T7P2W7_POMCA|nr:hypothetical protein C0Q70_12944 [Pomacea canaliculata]
MTKELRLKASNAVWGRRLCKSYGKGKNKLKLWTAGPSGCGKTTLLRCIVGLMKVDSGSLLAMGDVPSAPGHSIPGPMVGYMPQEISLYNELTIQEMLYFFGSVHGMTKSDIKHRTAFLLDFLKLPRHPTPIQQLSGGQKRRTSLAVALLHKPGLLILDEPTVGVDPLLREKIWEHLLEIAQSSEQTTIIVTTHYIEEARQADRVGLMRGGRLLDEDRPSKLMEQYSMTSLESIFLHLCHHDVIGNAQDEEFMSLSQSENDHLDSATSDEYQVNYDNRPLITTEVANSQSSNGSSSVPAKCEAPETTLVHPTIIAQVPLYTGIVHQKHDYLKTQHWVPFDNLDAGKKSVENGDTWGALYISPHFSEDMFLRLIMGINVTTEVVEGSTVYLYLDLTDSEISSFIQISTLESFQDFSKTQLDQFGFNAHYSDSPVQIGDPIYGKKGSTLTQFMAPGILLSISFFMAIGLTALAFVLEKKEGLYERNLVSGVNPAEVMIAHVLTQFLVLVVQVSLLLLFTFTVFDALRSPAFVIAKPQLFRCHLESCLPSAFDQWSVCHGFDKLH